MGAVQVEFFEEEQLSMQKTARRIIDEDINPFVDQWEAEGMYPAAKVMKKLGDAGLLGVNKPVEYGGMGLDFKYNIALNEELGNINCGGVPMSIAVQTDMATPALARFGSDELKKTFLEPSVLGDAVACLGVSEPGGCSEEGGRPDYQWSEDVDHQCLPSGLDVPSGQYIRRSTPQKQVLDLLAHEHSWYPLGQED